MSVWQSFVAFDPSWLVVTVQNSPSATTFGPAWPSIAARASVMRVSAHECDHCDVHSARMGRRSALRAPCPPLPVEAYARTGRQRAGRRELPVRRRSSCSRPPAASCHVTQAAGSSSARLLSRCAPILPRRSLLRSAAHGDAPSASAAPPGSASCSVVRSALRHSETGSSPNRRRWHSTTRRSSASGWTK